MTRHSAYYIKLKRERELYRREVEVRVYRVFELLHQLNEMIMKGGHTMAKKKVAKKAVTKKAPKKKTKK